MLRTACIVVLLLVLGGCTGSRSASPSPAAGTQSGPSATVSRAPAPPAPPRRGACYRLTAGQLARPTNGSRPVPCTGVHTARTIFVGRLDTVVDGHSVAVDSATVQRQLSTACPRRLATYVGGSAGSRDLSRFNVVWWSPTLAQSDRGADWFRCDLIAFSGPNTLLPLPRKGSLQGVLGRPGALGTYGLCGTAAPGTARFQRVICSRTHSWRALTTIPLAGSTYPGVRTVRAGGDARCKAAAKAVARNTLKFTYGWEWPTADQWAGGQHYGYCWVPA
ncbi:MAG: septum formation family protein [Nocardioidaceae bacterium]